MQNKHIIAATSITALLFTALPALAQTEPRTPGAAFCTNLPTISSKITANITEREQKISQHQSDVSTKKTTRWSEQDAKLATKRSEADARRAEQYAKLDAKATTDGEKAAVAAFKSTVDAAVVTRKAAVDAAAAAYRSGVDAALTAHAAAMSTAQTTFKSSVDAAIAKATTDCAAEGADGLAIRTALRASIKSAEDVFKTARKDNTLEGKRQELAAARKASVDAAMTAFKATLDQAGATLRAAFPPTMQ